MEKLNILIVDDEALVREGLRALLEKEDFVKHVFEAAQERRIFNSALTLQSFDLVLWTSESPEHRFGLFQALKRKDTGFKVDHAHGFSRERSLSLTSEIRGEQYSLQTGWLPWKCSRLSKR